MINKEMLRWHGRDGVQAAGFEKEKFNFSKDKMKSGKCSYFIEQNNPFLFEV